MPLTTPVYVIKLLHMLKLLHLPLTAPVYVRRLLHLAFLHLPAFLHLGVLHSWFVGVALGCRCFPFTQLYTIGSVRGWSSCTIRPISSEDILHNSVHVVNIFLYE